MTKVEIFENMQNEFRKRGFVTDPRGDAYGRSLYDPNTKFSVHIGNVGTVTAGICVIDMVNDGMNWGTAYKKLSNGCEIRFDFKRKTFYEFYNTTYTNRVRKMKKDLANQ